eukprot:evm.model.NODE_13633_length_3668_cov_5.911668.1
MGLTAADVVEWNPIIPPPPPPPPSSSPPSPPLDATTGGSGDSGAPQTDEGASAALPAPAPATRDAVRQTPLTAAATATAAPPLSVQLRGNARTASGNDV